MRYNLAILRELPVFRAILRPHPGRGSESRPRRCWSRSATDRPTAGMKVVPGAKFDDGLLDVLVPLQDLDARVPAGLPQGLQRRACRPPGRHDPPRAPGPPRATGIVGYADGERFAPLPLSCEVVPGALTVLT